MDILKIISIMIVFVYHIMMDMYVIHPMHNLKFIEELLIRPNVHIVMVACAIFVLISGATIKLNERNESLFDFYKRRLLKLLIPFYITYVIYFIIKAITFKNIHLFGGIEKWRFIWTILGVDEYLNAAGIKTFTLGIGEWFLGCILICYIFYPILSYFDKKYKIATFVLMTIYNIFINVFYEKLNIQMPQHFNVLCQIYNFYIGIFIASFLKNVEYLSINRIAINIFCCIISVFFYFCPRNIGIVENVKSGIALSGGVYLLNLVSAIPDNIKVTIMSVAICILFSNIERVIERCEIIVELIKKFGLISFEFFLTHHFVIYEVDYLLGYRRLGGLATLAVMVIDFVLTLLFALLVNKISKMINRFIV